MEKETFHPSNLDEAVDYLTKHLTDEDRAYVLGMTEEKFGATSHMFSGMGLRNRWFLWWSEGHTYDTWPKEKPAIVKYFNDLGIWHADDMSGIILDSFYRKLKGEDIRLDEQVKHYQDYWKKNKP